MIGINKVEGKTPRGRCNCQNRYLNEDDADHS